MKHPDDIGRMAQHFEEMHKRHQDLRHRFMVTFLVIQIAATATIITILAALAIAVIRWLA